MHLQVNDTQMQTLVSAAIMEQIGPEQRDKLLTDAIASLLAKPPDQGYGRVSVSPLQQAFNDAAKNVAQRLITTKLETDESFKAKIDSLLQDVVKQVLEGAGREKLVNDMAGTLSAALAKLRNEY